MTTRDLNNLPNGAWTGDVWKLIPILKTYRPELKITILDCKPTGLVLVSNLSPTNTTLAKNYDKILAEYTDMTLEDFGADRFAETFALTSSEDYRAAGYPDFAAIRLPDETFVAPAKTRA